MHASQTKQKKRSQGMSVVSHCHWHTEKKVSGHECCFPLSLAEEFNISVRRLRNFADLERSRRELLSMQRHFREPHQFLKRVTDSSCVNLTLTRSLIWERSDKRGCVIRDNSRAFYTSPANHLAMNMCTHVHVHVHVHVSYK